MRNYVISLAFCCSFLLAACSFENLLTGATSTPVYTPTAIPTPTPTPEPMAAKVNGEPITMNDFEREVARFEKAQTTLGNDPATLGDYRRRVLNSMIEERVAAQAATTSGRVVLAEQIEAVLQSSRQARGGEAGFQTWLKDNLYSEEEFRTVIRRQLLIQTATDAIASQVPSEAEQVHARHILVSSSDSANNLLSLLANGSDFAALASSYSQDISTRTNGGDLGWFARGTLSTPEVEEAAFSLQPGQTSQVVQSRFGYHIIQTLERVASRPLTPAAFETLRRRAVEAWLAQQLQKATIEIFIP